jgi:hypothetical protein
MPDVTSQVYGGDAASTEEIAEGGDPGERRFNKLMQPCLC